jgi:MFS family permease
VFSVSFAVLNAATPEDVRGRVMSFAYLPLNVGMVFGPLLAAPIVESFGVAAVFPLSAVLTLMSVGLLSRARRFDSQ